MNILSTSGGTNVEFGGFRSPERARTRYATPITQSGNAPAQFSGCSSGARQGRVARGFGQASKRGHVGGGPHEGQHRVADYVRVPFGGNAGRPSARDGTEVQRHHQLGRSRRPELPSAMLVADGLVTPIQTSQLDHPTFATATAVAGGGNCLPWARCLHRQRSATLLT
jgi:hypothetical protein